MNKFYKSQLFMNLIEVFSVTVLMPRSEIPYSSSPRLAQYLTIN